MQLTYNTQNWVGTGCWESLDGGLSDFGRDVVTSMNQLGILVDLSHVGPKNSGDAPPLEEARCRHSWLPGCDEAARAQQD